MLAREAPEAQQGQVRPRMGNELFGAFGRAGELTRGNRWRIFGLAVIAWLLRHPAGIQAVIGTTNPARIRACARATQIQLSREDWYRLYVAARGQPLP